ncbi:hypothetical protein QF042_001466 [Pedobacter sp. W3I1]|nr:hypothetical protein [Pedobacter sp. W3I1]
MLRHEASVADETDTSCLSMTTNSVLLLVKSIRPCCLVAVGRRLAIKDKCFFAPYSEQAFQL